MIIHVSFIFSGLILVTDCTSALGFESGVHHIGGKIIEVKNGAAYIQGTDTLSGSILPLIKCVRFFKNATGTYYHYHHRSIFIEILFFRLICITRFILYVL